MLPATLRNFAHRGAEIYEVAGYGNGLATILKPRS